MKNLTPKQKNILTIVFVIAACIVLVVINLIDKNAELKKEQENSMKTVIVTDNSRYFTVLNCVNKFLNYIEIGNSSYVLSVLDDDYKNSFRITENNYRNFVPVLMNDYSYNYAGDEMYQHRISKNVVEYYIKGRLHASQMEGYGIYTDYDVTVILYEDSLTFAIKPGVEGLKL